MPNNIELRNLETWHDDSEGKLDESCYEELADSANTDGWSADDMFKYNETRHKIMSSYIGETTLAKKYTTPLPEAKSKSAIRMASKLAKEIEDKVASEGRVTPESSDDDELFERERTKRTHLRQLKQLNQLLNLKNISNINLSFGNWQSQLPSNGTNGPTTTTTTTTTGSSTNHFEPPNTSYNHATSSTKSNRSSSQHSNSSTTPATASLSSSPILNDSNLIMKPVTSSSRNILRTCLT